MKHFLPLILLYFFSSLIFPRSYSQSDSSLFSESSLSKDTVKESVSFSDLSDIDYQWISYRMKVNVNRANNQNSLQLFFVNKIDSIIYLNIHVSGIEIIRIVMTPGQFTYVNKMDYNYLVSDYKQLEKSFGLPLDFYMLQSLFNGVDFNGFDTNFVMMEENTQLMLVSEKRCRNDRNFCINHQLILNNSHLIIESFFSSLNQNRPVKICYSREKKSESTAFFNAVKVEIPQFRLIADAELKNVKFNIPGPTSIKIPNSFELIKIP